MTARYQDITGRLGVPLWYDESGVPRYDKFAPELLAKTEARQVSLVRMACPICRMPCDVAYSMQEMLPHIRSVISSHGGHVYGLLPHYTHCGRPAMGDVVGVQEVWTRRDLLKWRRE